MSSALDRLVPEPRLVEIDHIDLEQPAEKVWEIVRHGDLARSPLIRALFALRALPSRIAGEPEEPLRVRIDEMRSTPEKPGFALLIDEPPHEFAVGAIGAVWEGEIPFEHVPDAAAFAAYRKPGVAKVAWSLRVTPRGPSASRLEVEVRVDTTDAESWQRFRRYFRLIGPGSRFIRHTLLGALGRELGVPDARENQRAFASDELLPAAMAQITHGITIAATPQAIWPWLIQMGARRGGFYSIDWVDNAGVPSAREIHPDLQALQVGQVLPATPDGDDGFEVLRLDAPRSFVLGGLFDVDADRQIPFAATPPARHWQVTWAFELEPIDHKTTRLHARARAKFSPDARLHVAWIRPVHHLMEMVQLRRLAARAEGRLGRDNLEDVLEGVSGAARMVLAMLTPWLRGARSHWGLTPELAARALPGDELVPEPLWSWTHGIEIDAAIDRVWPWIAQIGAERAGLYSYQWLENLAGCNVQNAEAVHPAWALREGDTLSLHPKAPALRIVTVSPGHHLVAFGAPDEIARAASKPWASASWSFVLEPLAPRRTRLVSRLRTACSSDLAMRLAQGPAIVGPVGYVMDRRLLLGVKERAEKLEASAKALHFVNDQPSSR